MDIGVYNRFAMIQAVFDRVSRTAISDYAPTPLKLTEREQLETLFQFAELQG